MLIPRNQLMLLSTYFTSHYIGTIVIVDCGFEQMYFIIDYSYSIAIKISVLNWLLFYALKKMIRRLGHVGLVSQINSQNDSLCWESKVLLFGHHHLLANGNSVIQMKVIQFMTNYLVSDFYLYGDKNNGFAILYVVIHCIVIVAFSFKLEKGNSWWKFLCSFN